MILINLTLVRILSLVMFLYINKEIFIKIIIVNTNKYNGAENKNKDINSNIMGRVVNNVSKIKIATYVIIFEEKLSNR